MPRQFYDPKVKAAIAAAAKDAIKVGNGVAGPLQAATAAGYKGEMSGLKKVVYPARKKAKKAKKAAPPSASPLEPKGRRGRKIYDPKVKAAFMTAAKKARKAGKSWAKAFDAPIQPVQIHLRIFAHAYRIRHSHGALWGGDYGLHHACPR
jgi:hypothetical protein